MNIDSFRHFCLSFPSAKENLQWGGSLCFKVGGKIFAVLGVDAVPPNLCFKCTPETFAELTEQEGIVRAPYVGRYKWVQFERLDILRDAELEELIRESYRMIAAKTKVTKNKIRPVKKKPRKKT